MRNVLRAFTVLALASAAPAQAATVFDAFASFNGTNGAGNFRWASSAPPNPPTFLSTTPCVINNTICLGLPGGSFDLPGVFKSTGIASTSHPYQPLDRLLVHPGSASGLNAYFFAPTAGQYSYNVVLDNLAGGAVGVFAGTTAGGSFSTIGTGFLGSVGALRTFSGTLNLAANEFIIVGVNNAGSFINDSTGLRFTVTDLAVAAAVPEPATWMMMIAGFGFAGWRLRRKGRSSVMRPALAAG